MANIVAATLLLVVLVNCFSYRTAHCEEFHSAGFTTTDIRKCRCSSTPSDKKYCRYPLIPRNDQRQEAKLCRESQTNHKVKICRPPQTYKNIQAEKLALKYCLCCKLKNRINRSPAIKSFCSFSCVPMPL